MCDDKLPNMGHLPYTRRQFAGLIGAAGAVGLSGAASAQAAPTETDVVVKTPDGNCDAVLFHPAGAKTYPGVLLWPDAGGLRPVKRDMGKRLAAQGYVVLVVNPYYRGGAAPAIATLNTQVPEQAAKRTAARPDPEGAARDAVAFVAYLDALKETSNAKVGVQGYCMGGALSVRTAAAVPGRIGAVGSFHGGNGLIAADANSPHLLIPKTQARYLFATAKNDNETNPAIMPGLKEALDKAGRPGIVDLYQANHGWCVPDGAQYNQAEAERAWTALSAMYKQALV
jgi:carboxymethylenebutenolidase